MIGDVVQYVHSDWFSSLLNLFQVNISNENLIDIGATLRALILSVTLLSSHNDGGTKMIPLGCKNEFSLGYN